MTGSAYAAIWDEPSGLNSENEVDIVSDKDKLSAPPGVGSGDVESGLFRTILEQDNDAFNNPEDAP